MAHDATLRPTYAWEREAVDVLVDGGIELVRAIGEDKGDTSRGRKPSFRTKLRMRGRYASPHSHLSVAHDATLRPTYAWEPEAVDVLVDGGIELVRGL